MPYDNDNVEEQPSQLSFGVAIILYTGPPASPFTSWTLISHVENQPDIITGANRFLADLRRGVGGVIGMSFHLHSSKSFLDRKLQALQRTWGEKHYHTG